MLKFWSVVSGTSFHAQIYKSEVEKYQTHTRICITNNASDSYHGFSQFTDITWKTLYLCGFHGKNQECKQLLKAPSTCGEELKSRKINSTCVYHRWLWWKRQNTGGVKCIILVYLCMLWWSMLSGRMQIPPFLPPSLHKQHWGKVGSRHDWWMAS